MRRLRIKNANETRYNKPVNEIHSGILFKYLTPSNNLFTVSCVSIKNDNFLIVCLLVSPFHLWYKQNCILFLNIWLSLNLHFLWFIIKKVIILFHNPYNFFQEWKYNIPFKWKKIQRWWSLPNSWKNRFKLVKSIRYGHGQIVSHRLISFLINT